jgi:hypothetical protein
VVEDRCRQLASGGRIVRVEGAAHWPDGTVADRFEFVHDVHRQVLLDRLSAARRADLHRRLGGRLRDAWGNRADEIAAELARHAVEGHEVEPAVRYLRAAARVAVGRGAAREAAEHLTRALKVLADWPDRARADSHEPELQAALGAALVASRGWADSAAEAAYVRAAELARAGGDDESLARALYGLATLYEYRGEYAASQALIEERLALGLVGATPDRQVESYELLACSLFHQGAFADSLEHARRGIAAAGRSDAAASLGEDPEASCHGWAALSLWFLGDAEAAAGEAQEAIAAGRAQPHGLAGALAQAARVHQHRGEPERTRQLASAAHDEARRGGFTYVEATSAVLLGWAKAVLGDAAGADEAERGLVAHEASGAAMDRPYYAGLAAEALAFHGRVAEALAVLDGGMSLIAPERPFFYAGPLQRLRDQIVAATGVPTRAAANGGPPGLA